MIEHSRLVEYIERWLDGTLSAPEIQLLKAELLRNPEALETYVDIAETHGLLIHGNTSPISHSNVVPVDQILQREKRRNLKIAALAAAAIVVLSLISLKLFFVTPPPTTLAFQTSPGTLFTLSHENSETPPQNQTLEPGSRLQLEQGSIELTLSSGVKSIILAPADLTLHDYQTLYLNTGLAWFEVGKDAVGFTVKTKELEVVDLGTEFGVHSAPDDYDEVHVFKGSVLAKSLVGNRPQTTLTAGEARKSTLTGGLAAIPAQPKNYLTDLPDQLPFIRWTFDKNFQASGSHPDAHTIHTTPLNNPNRSVGIQGTALTLNGNQQSLETDWPGFAGDRPRSVSFWVKFPQNANFTSFPACVNWGDNTQGNSKWKIMLAQDKKNSPPYLRLSFGGTWLNGTTHLQPNRWYHILVTSPDKPNQKGLPTADMYINFSPEKYTYKGFTGVPKNKGMNTATTTRNANPLRIGKSIVHPSNATPTFHGEIDELTIYDGYLSPLQVKAIKQDNQR
ncbi:LamG-like jellyroll fold domain-containing protein [Rubritalea tangerina]|uniref:LamG-like jellyroll fold domain-containing protein n=1 Tax=Rubritalea tangerina TaxID=430798 RepID=A0ABW4Z9J5_9BACT